MNKIITIGREFGSGGRELGKRIAEKLQIAYYDKEIVSEIAKKTDLAVDYVQQVIEDKPMIDYPISVAGTFNHNYGGLNSTSQSVYREQCSVLRELANKSSCVIVGRCADYILRDLNPFRIFVYSDLESKLNRCKLKGELDNKISDKRLKRMIKSIDKKRSQYYSFCTSQEWGNKLNYDICINTSGKNIKDVVEEVLTVLH